MIQNWKYPCQPTQPRPKNERTEDRIGGWNGVTVLMNLTWFFKNSKDATILFQGLPGLIYTLKLKSKSLIWLDEYKMAPETVLSLWQYAAGLLKGGVASLETLPVS